MEPVYDSWRLVSLSPWPAPVLAALALLGLAGLLFAARGLRGEPRPRRRRLLLSLRLLSLLAALGLLAEPGLRRLQTARVKNRVAVLVDGSASMGFPAEPGGPSRAALAGRYLQEVTPALAALGDRYELEYLRFDADVAPAALDGLARGEAQPKGTRTDLLGALRGVSGAGGRKLVGALVLSDGADNADLDGKELSPRARDELSRLGVPVSAVAVGGGELRDVAIESVKVDDFAFVRTTATLEVTVAVSGLGSLELPVVLRRAGTVIGQQTVEVRPGQRTYPVSFSFAPDQIGEFVFTVSAPVQAGEVVTANNARSFVLKVIRDRVRTLLVVGRPSWDQRFLRSLLKQDPNVDLISFFILRTPQDESMARQDELSLIPFPVDEIFDKQLSTFDLVIFQDFGYRPYRMESYLPNLRRYVEEGGGLVMIGGEESFGEGGYDRSPLGEVLPVEGLGAAPSEAPFRPRLTEAGLRSPITALLPGLEANRLAWEKLPELPGVNVVIPKPGATVLLDHPALTLPDGRPAPVLAVAEPGRGRVMALTTDSSWYWSMPAAGGVTGSPRGYERFWANAIRWLVRDPELTPLRVEAVSDEVEPGEPVAVVVEARRSDYGPAAGADIGVKLVEADTGREVAQRYARADDEGAARLELRPPGPGAYQVVGVAQLGGVELGRDDDAVAVRAASAELSDPAPRPALLRALADATGGGFAESESGRLPELRLPEPEVVEIGRAEDEPLWNRPWWLALLACTLGAEWILRRRWGWY